MKPEQIIVDPVIFERFPGCRIGIMVVSGIDNSGEQPQIISMLRTVEEQVRQELAGMQAAEHLQIVPWRDAYRSFGANPKKYPSSIENLVARVLRGSEIRHINTLVDIYNLISLRYIVPAGGEDLDKMDGDIHLSVAGASEPPVVLLGEAEPRQPIAGEILYKDNTGAICRRWNWKEADRTKLTAETRNAILVIEALPPVSDQILQQALSDLSGLVVQYCGGEQRTGILTGKQNALPLALR